MLACPLRIYLSLIYSYIKLFKSYSNRGLLSVPGRRRVLERDSGTFFGLRSGVGRLREINEKLLW